MVDLSVTAANVLASTGSGQVPGTYGATVTAGKVVYQNTSTDDYDLADCTTSAATATVAGIALNGGADGQPASILTRGPVDIGATVTVGTVYVLSESGGICPAADLATDDYVSIIGVGTAADTIEVNILNSGVQVP